jgi:membrane-associated phospholipid phosphatase
LIASDRYISKNAPNSSGLTRAGDHFRKTGLLSFEALADVTIIQYAMKSIFDRQRPLEGQGNGEFGASSGARYSSSFPSGHAIETFALASVLAHEYPHKRWVQVLAYSYAAGVAGARLASKQHFPGDVMAGGAIGWFVGDFVYGKRNNPALDKTPTVTEKILDHLQIGMAPQPGFNNVSGN